MPGATLVERVLAARGLNDRAEAERFLSPELGQLHDPSLLHGLDRAAERIVAAVRRREPIAIYGDYDVDGITATAILFHMIRALDPGADVRTYVPHRVEEGYGLSGVALLRLAREGARVIVSVDCGAAALGPARELKQASGGACDLIITDHHRFDESGLPEAFAIVHPRLGAYPFGDLCGAGVAYKLAWRLATMWCNSQRVSESLKELLIELLGLAAMGAVADVVPLVGENRVIVSRGLPRIRRSPLPGVRELVEASRLDGASVQEEDVGFRLAPRLNACGRMGHAREAVELLTTASPERAREIARELDRLNGKRQVEEREIVESALLRARAEGMAGPERRAVVLAHESWRQGVVGIACARLVERLHRPTLLLEKSAGLCKGSGRSSPGFDLYAALCRCGHLLTSFGGHEAAAGLTVEAGRFEEFAEAFVAVANETLGPQDLVGRVEYDAPAALSEITMPVVETLNRLAPFGRSNPRVQFRIDGLRLDGRPEFMGSSNQHLRLRAVQGSKSLRMIGWNMAAAAATLRPGAEFDAVVSPRVNEWNGMRKVEAVLVDFAMRP